MSESCPGHHPRPRSASGPHPGPRLLRLQGLLPHPLRDRLLQGPRPPSQAHKEVREVQPPPLRPTRYWDRVDLVCIFIGHSGTTLKDTASNIATALAKVSPSHDIKGKSSIPKTREPIKTFVINDKQVTKTLLDKLCALAQTRLLGIITKKNQIIKDHAFTNNIRNTQTVKHENPIHQPLSTPRPPSKSII
jgi:hypothetical protein